MAAGGSARAACWGELFSAAARARGARGTLIDGYCRNVPVSPGSATRCGAGGHCRWTARAAPQVTAWRQPAVVGGLPVRPGDLVVADDDGAVVIPAELTEETIGRALAKASKETGWDALEAGGALRAAYGQFGVL